MPALSVTKRVYPWKAPLGDQEITIRIMQRSDLETAIRFARTLPEDDLMFLTMDITNAEAMSEYYKENEAGKSVTVIAEANGEFVGYGSLHCSQPSWTRHLGEIRLLVSPSMRGKGLGRVLASEVLHLAHDRGLQKMIARMAVEQRGAASVFEKLGFRSEALLTDFVMDRHGRTHDLIVMTYDVTGLN